jgi:hypothetical protein
MIFDDEFCQRAAITGTAGVRGPRRMFFLSAGVLDSPASSNAFTRAGVSLNSGDVAFNESGRDARGPSNKLVLGAENVS